MTFDGGSSANCTGFAGLLGFAGGSKSSWAGLDGFEGLLGLLGGNRFSCTGLEGLDGLLGLEGGSRSSRIGLNGPVKSISSFNSPSIVLLNSSMPG